MSVTLVVADHVATVTLDRPQVLHAIDLETEQKLQAIWQEIEARADVRVVVLAATGERAFCAGADLKNTSGLSGLEYWARPRPGGFGGIAMRETAHLPPARAHGLRLPELVSALGSEDSQEGVLAFQQKRKPQWAGR